MSFIVYTLIIFLQVLSLFVASRNPIRTVGADGTYRLVIPMTQLIFLSGFIYVLVRTFAYQTAVDYMAYYRYYLASAHHAYDYWGSTKELGFKWIIESLSNIIPSPAAFFFFSACLHTIILFIVARNYGKAAPYIVAIWFVFMFNLSMNLYRQYIALDFCMLFTYLLLHNSKKYYVLIIMAMLAFVFHKSSAFGIAIIVLVYLTRKTNVSKWVFISLIVMTSVASSFVVSYFGSEFGYFSDLIMDEMGHSYYFEEIIDTYYDRGRMVYVNMLVYIIIVFYADRVLRRNDKLQFLFYILALAFILEPITRQEILMRMRLYITNIMIIGYGLTLYLNIKEHQFVNNLVLYVAVFYQFSYNYVYSNYALFTAFPLQIMPL